MSDGIKPDIIYALISGQSKLYEINIKKREQIPRDTGNNYNFNFGSLYDTMLINTGYDDFIVIARFCYNSSYYWSAYSYKSNKWINLSNWVRHQSCGSSLFFEPETYQVFYRINGKECWEHVDLTETKIKGKEISIDDKR